MEFNFKELLEKHRKVQEYDGNLKSRTMVSIFSPTNNKTTTKDNNDYYPNPFAKCKSPKDTNLRKSTIFDQCQTCQKSKKRQAKLLEKLSEKQSELIKCLKCTDVLLEQNHQLLLKLETISQQNRKLHNENTKREKIQMQLHHFDRKSDIDLHKTYNFKNHKASGRLYTEGRESKESIDTIDHFRKEKQQKKYNNIIRELELDKQNLEKLRQELQKNYKFLESLYKNEKRNHDNLKQQMTMLRKETSNNQSRQTDIPQLKLSKQSRLLALVQNQLKIAKEKNHRLEETIKQFKNKDQLLKLTEKQFNFSIQQNKKLKEKNNKLELLNQNLKKNQKILEEGIELQKKRNMSHQEIYQKNIQQIRAQSKRNQEILEQQLQQQRIKNQNYDIKQQDYTVLKERNIYLEVELMNKEKQIYQNQFKMKQLEYDLKMAQQEIQINKELENKYNDQEQLKRVQEKMNAITEEKNYLQKSALEIINLHENQIIRLKKENQSEIMQKNKINENNKRDLEELERELKQENQIKIKEMENKINQQISRRKQVQRQNNILKQSTQKIKAEWSHNEVYRQEISQKEEIIMNLQKVMLQTKSIEQQTQKLSLTKSIEIQRLKNELQRLQQQTARLTAESLSQKQHIISLQQRLAQQIKRREQAQRQNNILKQSTQKIKAEWSHNEVYRQEISQKEEIIMNLQKVMLQTKSIEQQTQKLSLTKSIEIQRLKNELQRLQQQTARLTAESLSQKQHIISLQQRLAQQIKRREQAQRQNNILKQSTQKIKAEWSHNEVYRQEISQKEEIIMNLQKVMLQTKSIEQQTQKLSLTKSIEIQRLKNELQRLQQQTARLTAESLSQKQHIISLQQRLAQQIKRREQAQRQNNILKQSTQKIKAEWSHNEVYRQEISQKEEIIMNLQKVMLQTKSIEQQTQKLSLTKSIEIQRLKNELQRLQQQTARLTAESLSQKQHIISLQQRLAQQIKRREQAQRQNNILKQSTQKIKAEWSHNEVYRQEISQKEEIIMNLQKVMLQTKSIEQQTQKLSLTKSIEIQRLKNELQRLQQQTARLTAESLSQKQHIISLQQRLAQQIKRREQAQRQNNILKQSTQKIKAEWSHNEVYRQEISQKEEIIMNLQKVMLQTKSIEQQTQKLSLTKSIEIQRLKNELQRLQQQTARLTAESLSQKQHIISLQQRLAQQIKRREQAQRQNNILKQSTQKIKAEWSHNEVYRQEISQKEEIIMNLQKVMLQTKSIEQQTQKLSLTKSIEIQRLKNELQRLQQQTARLTAESLSQKQHIISLQQRILFSVKQSKNKTLQIQRLNNQLQQKNSSLLHIQSSAIQTTRNFQSTIQSLQINISTLQNKIQQMQLLSSRRLSPSKLSVLSSHNNQELADNLLRQLIQKELIVNQLTTQNFILSSSLAELQQQKQLYPQSTTSIRSRTSSKHQNQSDIKQNLQRLQQQNKCLVIEIYSKDLKIHELQKKIDSTKEIQNAPSPKSSIKQFISFEESHTSTTTM